MAKSSSRKKARVISSKVVYRGPVFRVISNEVIEPGGVRARRDIIRHGGSVVILAVDESRRGHRVLLVRQYRHAVEDYLWELPAGRVDEGEKEPAAAKRELLEETGYRADEWKRALKFYVSPGFLDETMAIYLARGLHSGAAQPEEDEIIQKRMFPLSSTLRMIGSGRISDAKTMCGVLWLAQFQSSRKARG